MTSYIEREEKSFSIYTLIKLANALDISVDILLKKKLKYYTSEKFIVEMLADSCRIYWLATEINKLDDIYKSVLELKCVSRFSIMRPHYFYRLKIRETFVYMCG